MAAAPLLKNLSPIADSALQLAALGDRGKRLLDLVLGSSKLLVLTGAGISTASGIPDYRSPGRPPYKPLQHGQYVTDFAVRRRYWARSTLGYYRMRGARPNPAHTALAQLQAAGRAANLITQNVDRLHQAAGHTHVLELHGTIHEVHCMHPGCSAHPPHPSAHGAGAGAGAAAGAAPGPYTREYVQGLLTQLNQPWLRQWQPHALARPDGDVELAPGAYETFAVPPCPACGAEGLKPSVVFHGGHLEPGVAAASRALAASADGLLVVGTSLSTFSASRLVKEAVDRGVRVGVLVAGPTRADPLLGFGPWPGAPAAAGAGAGASTNGSFKVEEHSCASVLQALVSHMTQEGLLQPPAQQLQQQLQPANSGSTNNSSRSDTQLAQRRAAAAASVMQYS